jgi:2-phosphosulfolactate phosphatase
MKIEVHFTSAEFDPASVAGATAVVVDVVRATTSIVEALANGAVGVFPTTSTEDAVRLASSLGREDALLCGERRGEKVEGFDLGNSPAEFAPDVVGEKKLVMSTTNGTRAFGAVTEAERVIACAFTNLGAVARAVAGDDRLVVLCAGREGRFSFDDALCAGHLIRRVLDGVKGEVELDDAARASCTLADGIEPDRDFLDGTAAGRSLAEIGLADDLDICVDVDRHDIVPVMRDQAITLGD